MRWEPIKRFIRSAMIEDDARLFPDDPPFSWLVNYGIALWSLIFIGWMIFG